MGLTAGNLIDFMGPMKPAVQDQGHIELIEGIDGWMEMHDLDRIPSPLPGLVLPQVGRRLAAGNLFLSY